MPMAIGVAQELSHVLCNHKHAQTDSVCGVMHYSSTREVSRSTGVCGAFHAFFMETNNLHGPTCCLHKMPGSDDQQRLHHFFCTPPDLLGPVSAGAVYDQCVRGGAGLGWPQLHPVMTVYRSVDIKASRVKQYIRRPIASCCRHTSYCSFPVVSQSLIQSTL